MNDDTQLLFDFTEHLKVLNRSPATIKLYTGNVRCYLTEQEKTKTKDIKAVTRTDMETYVAVFYEKDKKYSVGTICVKVRSLKRFFEYLEQSNIIFINISLSPKRIKPSPVISLPERRWQNSLINRTSAQEPVSETVQYWRFFIQPA